MLQIAVGGPTGFREYQAVIDTGFSGDIKLAEEFAEQLGLEMLYMHGTTLANGQTHDVPAALGFVWVDKRLKEVTILIAPGETMIGIGLFKKLGCLMTLHCGEDWVTLETRK